MQSLRLTGRNALNNVLWVINLFSYTFVSLVYYSPVNSKYRAPCKEKQHPHKKIAVWTPVYEKRPNREKQFERYIKTRSNKFKNIFFSAKAVPISIQLRMVSISNFLIHKILNRKQKNYQLQKYHEIHRKSLKCVIQRFTAIL